MSAGPQDLPPEVLQAINNIADYCWKDELEDAAICADENGDLDSPHIFNHFVTIDNWVNATHISPQEHIKALVESMTQ